MSWMDSWSRPGKTAAVPPPLYLTSSVDVRYCQTCGRVMNSRKTQQKQTNEVKYCSDRCRNRKPRPIDKTIEGKIASLLDGEQDSGVEQTAAKSKIIKGDHRIMVTMDEIEEIVFGNRHDPTKTFGRRKNRASRAIGAKEGDHDWKTVDMEDSSSDDGDTEEPSSDASMHQAAPHTPQQIPGPRVRAPQTASEVNFSVGGERGWAEKIEETPEAKEKRVQGDKRAEEREMIRRAARRVIVFGVPDEHARLEKQEQPSSKVKTRSSKADKGSKEPDSESPRRKAEAVMNGALVDPSFAKGNWSIRWRERV